MFQEKLESFLWVFPFCNYTHAVISALREKWRSVCLIGVIDSSTPAVCENQEEVECKMQNSVLVSCKREACALLLRNETGSCVELRRIIWWESGSAEKKAVELF